MAIDSISLNKNAAAGLLQLTSKASLTLAVADRAESEANKPGGKPGDASTPAFLQQVFATLAQFGLTPPKGEAAGTVAEPNSGTARQDSAAQADQAKQNALHSFAHELLHALTPSANNSTPASAGELRLQVQYSADLVVRVGDLQQLLGNDGQSAATAPGLDRLSDTFADLVKLLGSDGNEQDPTPAGTVDLPAFLQGLADNLRRQPEAPTVQSNAKGNLVNTAA